LKFFSKNQQISFNKKLFFYKNQFYDSQTKNFFKNFSHDYYMFLYSFFLKKNFLKVSNFNNLRSPVKLNSFILKNYNTLNFLQNIFKAGNKLKSLKHLNLLRNSFYFMFTKKFDFFLKKFPSYNIYYTFSETEKKFFNLDFLFSMVFNINESIFNTKIIKLNKKLKQKTKTKSKYSLDFKYLSPNKRKNFLYKQIHLNSNNYNFYNYSERLFMSFCNTFFLEKTSDIYQSKVNTYKNILKKNSI